MRVYLFCDNFYPSRDGMVSVVDSYARFLKQNEVDVAVVTPYKKGYIDETPYRVIRMPSFRSSKEYPVAKRNFPKAFRDEIKNYDGPIIFHAHSPFVMGHAAKRFAKKIGIPFISTIHTKYRDDYKKMLRLSFLTYIMTKYTVHFFNKSTSVWACVDGAARELKRYGFKNNYIVMPNGIDIPKKVNEVETLDLFNKKYELSANDNVLLFVGHVIWQKNVKLILDTLKYLENGGFHFVMFFVGGGNFLEEVKKYAKNLNFENRVIFVGEIHDRNILNQFYQASDLFFFPSVFDNSPMTLREASILNTPSLLVEGSDSATNVIDNESGYLAKESVVAMSAKIREIFKDKTKMKEVGMNAKTAIIISWDEVIKDVILEYKKILNY